MTFLHVHWRFSVFQREGFNKTSKSLVFIGEGTEQCSIKANSVIFIFYFL